MITVKVRDKVLTILTNNMGQSISGEQMAAELQVSRTAVWKAVHSLKEQGFNIENKQGEGYTLVKEIDKIWAEGIKSQLTSKEKFNIVVLDTIDSTNNYLKAIALEGGKEGMVVVSDHQSAGRGRLGRRFHTPKGKGVYLSLLVKPREDFPINMLTVLTAVAVSNTIEQLTKLETKIKWVNDIYVGDKKLCGILTEAGITAESATIDWAIIGIGINVYSLKGLVPEDILDISTSLEDQGEIVDRNLLIGALLQEIMELYENFDKKQIATAYGEKQLVLGKNLTVTRGEESYPAKAIALDEDCHLIVEKPDGQTVTLQSGEVSLREWK